MNLKHVKIGQSLVDEWSHARQVQHLEHWLLVCPSVSVYVWG